MPLLCPWESNQSDHCTHPALPLNTLPTRARYWYQGQETTWAEPPAVTDFKRRAGSEAAAANARMRAQADAQRAAQQRDLVGQLQAMQAIHGPGHALGVPISAEALRRAHIEQVTAARAAAGGGGSKEARLAAFKGLLADAGASCLCLQAVFPAACVCSSILAVVRTVTALCFILG